MSERLPPEPWLQPPLPRPFDSTVSSEQDLDAEIRISRRAYQALINRVQEAEAALAGAEASLEELRQRIAPPRDAADARWTPAEWPGSVVVARERDRRDKERGYRVIVNGERQ